MTKHDNQTLRTFFHSLAIATAVTAAMVASGHSVWAQGFVIGAAVSLFSLLTLKLSIPALFHKGSTSRSTAMLQLLLILKVPIYGVGLYFAARLGSAGTFAAFTGCTLVPCVISVAAIVRASVQSNRGFQRALAMREPAAVLPAIEELSRQVAAIKAEAAEIATAAPLHVIPVREGAA